MQELESIVRKAQTGDTKAFERLVRRLQDMAVGYAYSVIGDFHLAEDAAQEAFVQVHRTLGQLREPNAFLSWFRKVVYTQCDRITRRKRVQTIALEFTTTLAADQPPLSEIVETVELQQWVQNAILSLPEQQRCVVTLFYISEYSQREIAAFLDIPLTTVKKRLFDAKKQLKQRMNTMTEDFLHENRPSRNDDFVANVMDVIAPRHTQHSEAVYSLFETEDRPDRFQWRAGRLAHSHADWEASRIGRVKEGDSQTVLAATYVYDITMRIGSAHVRTAGYNYWATHPAHSDERNLLIERTVTSSLATLREQGYDLSVSFDDEAFWYRQDYVLGWRALQWHVDVVDLPDTPSDLALHWFEPSHRDDLAQLYNQTHRSLTGTAVRPTYLRNKHPELFMGWYWTDAQGNPAGYITGGADRHVRLEASLQSDLDRGELSEDIRHQFATGSRWSNTPLSMQAVCKVEQIGSRWLIEDGERKCYIHKVGDQLYAIDFERPLFWVDEVAGDPESCLQVLGQLARQWQCDELFFDRLHYKSPVGKRLRQMISCRIHTGTFRRSPRAYVVRIINLQSLFTKLTPELALRLNRSPYADWQGNLLISTGEDSVMLSIEAGHVAVVPVSETGHTICGDQQIAQLVVGTEEPQEIVDMAGIRLGGDARILLPVLFPAQYPQMGNSAL